MELDELRDTMYTYEFGDDDVEFYFHLTQRENGNAIMENGLYLPCEKLSSGAIKIEASFYEDPDYYIDNELGNPQTRRKEIMVIIGRYDASQEKYNDRDLVQIDTEDGKEVYVIPSENILGYVDLDRKDFVSNPYSEFSVGSFGL